MSLTLQQIRRLLSQDLGGGRYVLDSAVSGASTTGAILDVLIDSAADARKYVDSWVYVPTNQQEARITTYTNTTGAIVWHMPITSPGTGAVEVHRFQPTLMHRGINKGLARMKYKFELCITPVADCSDYELASYTYITHEKDILGVYVESAVTGAPKSRVEVTNWRVWQADSGTLMLWIDPLIYTTTQANIVVVVKRPFGPLTLEADAITASELWTLAAVRVEFLKILVSSMSPGREVDRYRAMLGDALKDFRRQSALNQVQDSIKINLQTPFSLGRTHRGRGWT